MGDRDRGMPPMELSVLWAPPPHTPCSFPCVDCGLFTGNFCDGGPTLEYTDRCFAFERDPQTYREESTQRTPLCTYCETCSKYCRFCRGVSGCTPPPRRVHWSGTPRQSGIQNGRYFIAQARDEFLARQWQRNINMVEPGGSQLAVPDDRNAALSQGSRRARQQASISEEDPGQTNDADGN